MTTILGIIFVLGIVLTCSDGTYFPWLNLVGIWMVGTAGIWAERRHSHGE